MPRVDLQRRRPKQRILAVCVCGSFSRFLSPEDFAEIPFMLCCARNSVASVRMRRYSLQRLVLLPSRDDLDRTGRPGCNGRRERK